jgi:hypothetical protein
MERHKSPASRLAMTLATVGAIGALYELLAISTGAVPTITDLVFALPVWLRIGLIVAAVAAIVDHFGTRKVL